MGPTEKAERQVLQIAIPRPPRTQSGTVISGTDGKGKETNAANYNTETTSNPVGSAKYKAKTSPNPQKPTKTTPNPPPNPRSVTHIYKFGGSNPFGFYNTKSRVGGVGWGGALVGNPLCLVLYPGFPPEGFCYSGLPHMTSVEFYYFIG